MIGNYFKYVGLTLLFYAIVLSVLLFSLTITSQYEIWRNFDFLIWDAKHVFSIVNSGYNATTCAFFPFFPLVWKFLNCSPFLISLMNGLIYILSISFLFNYYKIDQFKIFLYLGLPSLWFMFLPYSESLLFLFSVIFIVGISENKISLASIALLLMSMTKPTAAVFIPAILVAESISSDSLFAKLKRSSILISSVLIGNFLVFWFQRKQTGQWFDFFRSQEQWGNKLQWPEFPLSTWSSPRVIWVDASAFWITMISALMMIYFVFRKMKLGSSIDRKLSYSLLYLAGTGFFVLLFRGGALFSLNRFIFASPFLLVAILEISKRLEGKIRAKDFFYIVCLLMLLSLLFASYAHIRTFLFFLLLAFFVAAWIFGFRSQVNNWLVKIIILILFCIQIGYGIVLLNGGWLA